MYPSHRWLRQLGPETNRAWRRRVQAGLNRAQRQGYAAVL
jgi:hypothetical protein